MLTLSTSQSFAQRDKLGMIYLFLKIPCLYGLQFRMLDFHGYLYIHVLLQDGNQQKYFKIIDMIRLSTRSPPETYLSNHQFFPEFFYC